MDDVDHQEVARKGLKNMKSRERFEGLCLLKARTMFHVTGGRGINTFA